MDLNGQARASHADRVVNSVLIVDDEFLRQAIDDFAARGKLDGAG